MGDIEMIAPGLRAEARRPIRRDAITKTAVGAPELSRPADLLGKLLVAPYPVDEHSHAISSKWPAIGRYIARCGAVCSSSWSCCL